MSGKVPIRGAKGGVSGAVLAGVLLVPATAIAAVAIVGATTRPPAAEASVGASTTTSSTVVEETTTTALAADDELSDEAAIYEACTEGALELVDKELAESLTDIEAAALDALRAICADHDLAIANPPAPEAIVKVVRVQEPATTTSTTAPSDEVSDDHHDGDDDRDHDEDHHEDEEDEEDDEDHHEDEEDEEDEDH